MITVNTCTRYSNENDEVPLLGRDCFLKSK